MRVTFVRGRTLRLRTCPHCSPPLATMRPLSMLMIVLMMSGAAAAACAADPKAKGGLVNPEAN
jgi:hypothetical protein